MKLSLYSPVLMRKFYAEPDDALKHAYDIGITAMTIFGTELEKRKLNDYKEYVGQYGIEIYGIVQGAALSELEASVRSSEINNVKKVIDEAAVHDVKNIMVAPSIKSSGEVSQVRCLKDKMFVRDTIVDGLNEIVEYAKGTGVTITLENFSMNTHPFSTIDEVLYMMQNVSGLKYTLDAGNFYCVGEDVLSAYSALKDYMSNMHIKDWVIDKFGYCIRPEIPALNGCTVGKGILPLRELMTELKNDGFDGECIMEINTIEIAKKDVEESAEFVKQYL